MLTPAREPVPPALLRPAAGALLAVVLAAGPARGETVAGEAAGVAVEIPAGWEHAEEGGVLMLADPAGEVAVVLLPLDAPSLDEALARLDREMAPYVSTVRAAGAPVEATVRGMTARVVAGDGTLDGRPLEWRATLVRRRLPGVLLVLALADPGALDRHATGLDGILTSLEDRAVTTPVVGPPPPASPGPQPPSTPEAAPSPGPAAPPGPADPVAPAGETMLHPEAGVEVWIPSCWNRSQDGDVMYVGPETEDAVVVLWVLDAGGIDEALTSMDAELSAIIPDLEARGEAETAEINGMPVVALDGRGTMDGTPVDVGVTVFMTPGGKALLVLAVAESARLGDVEAIFERMVSSIRPAP